MRSVPEATVLILEQNDRALRIEPRLRPRVLEEHERGEPEHLRLTRKKGGEGVWPDVTSTPAEQPLPLDILDAGIRSRETLAEVAAAASSIARRWGIVTALQPQDFADALKGLRVARR